MESLKKFPLGEIRLEIGCGDKEHWRREGGEFLWIDIRDYGQDLVWDVEEGIPLPDNSCAFIYCSHTLEHMDDLVGVMNECWRVLKPDGVLQIVVPHKDSEKALVPSHVRLFDKWTFDFFQFESYTKDYSVKPWTVLELVVNERPDIHVKMQPRK